MNGIGKRKINKNLQDKRLITLFGHGSSKSRRLFLAFVPGMLLLRTLLAAVGVDGGPIFQILAIENLELTPRQLGIAFGVGIVSLPLQIAAARIPLRRARRNSQLFFVALAIQCIIIAGLVAAGATGTMALVALAVAVIAEICVSVLHAPSWQPLMSVSLTGIQRQRLNSQWPAVSRGLLAGALILFEGFDSAERAAFLGACGVLAALSAVSLYALPKLRWPDQNTQQDESDEDAPVEKSGDRRILVAVGAVNLGALPLWLVYLKTSLWPQANLGVVGAVQTIASLIALLAWRATEGDLAHRGRISAVALAGGGLAAAVLAGPVDSNIEIAVVYGVTVAITICATVINLVMLEELHRRTSSAASVRAFTMLDVVESTSLQIGLVAAGFLILPTTTLPYRVFLLGAALAATATTLKVLRTH